MNRYGTTTPKTPCPRCEIPVYPGNLKRHLKACRKRKRPWARAQAVKS